MVLIKEKVIEKPEIELYDDSDSDFSEPELNEGLLLKEVEESVILSRFAFGLMLVSGMPGQGKDLFSTVWSYKLAKFFVGRHKVRDERPRSLFGPYTLFDEDKLLDDMAKMENIAKGEIPRATTSKKEVETLKQLTSRWQTETGEVMFQKAIAHLAEFWRYFHNRRPMNPMGIALGGIVKIKRHLDCLILGVTQQERELDAISCLPYADHEVRCSWSKTRPFTARCTIYKIRWVSSSGVFEMGSKKPTTIWINGARQRPELGMEVAFLPQRRFLSPDENSILEIVTDNPLINLYNLAEALYRDSQEVEELVQNLVQKGIIQCKRYFDLYNSKSAVTLKPRANFKM